MLVRARSDDLLLADAMALNEALHSKLELKKNAEAPPGPALLLA